MSAKLQTAVKACLSGLKLTINFKKVHWRCVCNLVENDILSPRKWGTDVV